MKGLFAVLVLINAGLFGYFTLIAPMTRDAPPVRAEIQPEAITLFSESELQARGRSSTESASRASSPTVFPQLACYLWGGFSSADLPKARAALVQAGLEANVREQVATDSSNYWVYIPPLNSRQAAQARVESLHALGIRDTFVVQDARWRNAISLGIFRDEALASRWADDLRARGVEDVVKDVRNPEGGQTSFALDNVPADLVQALEAYRPDFPRSELRQVDCP